jgi:hypothetical protein
MSLQVPRGLLFQEKTKLASSQGKKVALDMLLPLQCPLYVRVLEKTPQT